jgi:hypothetical protein
LEVVKVKNPEKQMMLAEQSAVTPPTVAMGLGYPMNRDEQSLDPTGWINSGQEIEKVSRETSR